MRPLKKRVKKSFQVVRNDSVILGETRRVIKWIQLKNKELMVIVNENKKWSCPEKQDEAIMDRIKYIFEWDWDSKSQKEIVVLKSYKKVYKWTQKEGLQIIPGKRSYSYRKF